ncbi:eukaryotic translation initiation factor 5A, putative [Trypanosoma equiperdum]|uniref:Eukaryotic translation initiation factor 5A n=4 Tax=Trypanozoon TaxID=39700 RepID=IF5A_TRYB2|nr:eukaryotic translation initiation factor 5a,putative [Trypanosoma brucei gambiense DAL972]XP_828167.1 eukaryotic translation initiation factor 5a, putative [Trypanosoma brucei brucei TREU927]Q387H6.1 RecName: Full=Eukaryotic translation initiation factor 5A; Short=eIF-5A [Trypanosoma brucei brucei TREU927]RHW68171.1 eukaryotic translation initiation factor 5A [Trypanosoma brucei equiperdum]SCU69592.1 eukaryotic translation initiation factor 5A, putative [Trypanosoma equiperdum]EAN79055.1 eu|eukprot:XP_011779223.1 eukaryotic translation initiation factor 5a,putative [Trypanosoma brucei gambiense DAL972]
MSDDEGQFAEGGAQVGSLTYPMQAGALKKGGYICINGRPCKVIDLSVSKTGKHGHAKVSIVALDIFTGNKMEDQAPSTHNVEVPFVKTATYSVLDIQEDREDPSKPAHLSLMDDEGETRDNLDMPPNAELAGQIKEQFDAGKDVLVVVVSAMGIDQILSFKNAAER